MGPKKKKKTPKGTKPSSRVGTQGSSLHKSHKESVSVFEEPRIESFRVNPISVTSTLDPTSIRNKKSKHQSIVESRHRPSSTSTYSLSSEMSLEQDILLMVLPETTQKIVHCQVGLDLFVDKTWCTVKKADILEEISLQDVNSPFYKIIHKITSYKPTELLIGYEPFGREEDQFYVCITEAGRDEVLTKLQEMRSEYLRKIQTSKGIKARPWVSYGSEADVDLFQLKKTRDLISLEWIGDIAKRCQEPDFSDCDPDSMKNGYTCLLPTDKDKPELVFMKTQDTGIQAVPIINELGVQTEPEIPTNASTQCAPETEIPGDEKSTSTVQPEDLNAFFDKYLNYLTEVLHYNEVYDLYYDDYPALVSATEDIQVHQYSAYRQYQAFTDVAAIEGKLVVSSSWHPNYTGIVAIAYANEIPCKNQQLEYDSDQLDYEEDKTDEEDGGKPGSDSDDEVQGAKEWLEEEKLERDVKEENIESFDKAVKKLKDIENAKRVWESKITEGVEEVRTKTPEIDSELSEPIYEYIEYVEPPPESEESEEEMLDQIGLSDDDTSQHEFVEVETTKQEEDVDIVDMRSFIIVTDQLGDLSQRDISYSQSISTVQSDTSDSKYSKPTPKTSKHKQHRQSSLSRTQWSKHRIPKKTSTRENDSSVAQSLHNSTMTLISTTPTDYISVTETDNSYIEPEPEQFEEVTDEEELKEEEEELPILEPNNPVLIWSFVDDLIPKLRLDSPYEVRCVEFCPHNGNYIAGGTVSGQIVIWDITGHIEQLEKPEELTTHQQRYRKTMEYLMEWRRDVRSKRRVRACAISSYEESHSDKITSLTWLTPFVQVSRLGEITQIPLPMSFSLQVITGSLNGDIKVWDLKADPFIKGKKQIQRYKTNSRFGRPESLDKGISPFSKLYRNWKPVITLKLTHNHLPVMLTGFAPVTTVYSRVRAHPPNPAIKETLEDRVKYMFVPPKDIPNIPHHCFIATAFGYPGNVQWEPLDEKTPVGNEGNITGNIGWWNTYHDGPITRISRHPFFIDICLTVGGHVFAIWHSADKEQPIMSKRYFGVRITDGFWSSLRPSLIRIARSDGVVEIWDLLIQSHAPANNIVVSGKVITNMSAPCLPEAHGLLGIADYNSAFRLFYIPRQFRVWTNAELERLTGFLQREPRRKNEMREWSKWWRENNVNLDREEKKEAEEKKKHEDEERLEQEKLEEARQKYNEEVYKWYMRRRGKPFLWREEAEERWRNKQEQHMHEVIMQKKKVDRAEMEILMRPIVKEKKNEAQKLSKVQEKLKQADLIFRSTVDLIFPKKTQITPIVQSQDETVMEDVFKKVDQYFGDGFNDLAADQLDLIRRSPWQFDFEFSELMDKYNSLRMLFNDRRRKRDKTLRWLRKKIKEDLLKEGVKIHVRKSHKERYINKRIKRREENIEWLKNTYGEDYNVHWDRLHPCRRFADRKFKVTLDDSISDFYDMEEESIIEGEDRIITKSESNKGFSISLHRMKSTLEIVTDIGTESVTEGDLDIDTTIILNESQYDGRNETAGPSRTIMKALDSKAKALGLNYRPSQFGTETKHTSPEMMEIVNLKSMVSPINVSFISLLPIVESEFEPHFDSEQQELNYITQPTPHLDVSSHVDTIETEMSGISHEMQLEREIQLLEEVSEVQIKREEQLDLKEELKTEPKVESDIEKDLDKEKLKTEPEVETDIEKDLDKEELKTEPEVETDIVKDLDKEELKTEPEVETDIEKDFDHKKEDRQGEDPSLDEID